MYHHPICDTMNSDRELPHLANRGLMPKGAEMTQQSEATNQKESDRPARKAQLIPCQ